MKTFAFLNDYEQELKHFKTFLASSFSEFIIGTHFSRIAAWVKTQCIHKSWRRSCEFLRTNQLLRHWINFKPESLRWWLHRSYIFYVFRWWTHKIEMTFKAKERKTYFRYSSWQRVIAPWGFLRGKLRNFEDQ